MSINSTYICDVFSAYQSFMSAQKKEHPLIKSSLHPKNKHRERYDFKQLIIHCAELKKFVFVNKFNDETIDFSNPEAVKMLNKALLSHFYGINFWNIPQGYLCPPIPGRADYIHHVDDLLESINNGRIPLGNPIRCLDIGVGANCVYPLIGHKEYGWAFIGTDIDQAALGAAQNIIDRNEGLKNHIELRVQSDAASIFRGVIHHDENFDLTICNPPFHASQTEANAGTFRKLTNLKQQSNPQKVLNFGGKSNELWCKGGELGFVQNMIHESIEFRNACLWFTTLLSKQSNLKSVVFELKKNGVEEFRIITMGQGNKVSRIIAWTFFNKADQIKWAEHY